MLKYERLVAIHCQWLLTSVVPEVESCCRPGFDSRVSNRSIAGKRSSRLDGFICTDRNARVYVRYVDVCRFGNDTCIVITDLEAHRHFRGAIESFGRECGRGYRSIVELPIAVHVPGKRQRVARIVRPCAHEHNGAALIHG